VGWFESIVYVFLSVCVLCITWHGKYVKCMIKVISNKDAFSFAETSPGLMVVLTSMRMKLSHKN